MEFQTLVEKRRSLRNFMEAGITKEELETIIKCAQEAPSWKNSETGRYYIVCSPEKLAEISEKALPDFNQNSSRNASALIVTTFEANRAGFERDGSATNELGNEWGAYDLGLQNMLLCLKAKELGYDTLIMGIRDAEVLRKELSIPASQHVVAVIALGKGAVEMKRPVRKELKDVVCFF